MKTKLDLKTFDFPSVSKLDLAFPTFGTIKELREEAKLRGFYDDRNNEYVRTFSKLFFSGGKVEFKKNIDEQFLMRCWGYCRAFMGSYAPKHEDKQAICAMLMSEIIEPIN